MESFYADFLKKGKSIFLFSLLLLTSFFSTNTIAQSCDYTIELFDSFGDGWNGSILTVTVAGTSTDYTIDDGDMASFTINAMVNDGLTFTYSPGTFENEVTYNILDSDGMVVFSDGPFPAVGVVFSTFACPTCPGASNLGIAITM